MIFATIPMLYLYGGWPIGWGIDSPSRPTVPSNSPLHCVSPWCATDVVGCGRCPTRPSIMSAHVWLAAPFSAHFLEMWLVVLFQPHDGVCGTTTHFLFNNTCKCGLRLLSILNLFFNFPKYNIHIHSRNIQLIIFIVITIYTYAQRIF